MTPERLEELRTRRKAVAESRDALLAMPVGDRRAHRTGSIGAWEKSVHDTEKLLAQMDSLLQRMEVKERLKATRRATKARPVFVATEEVIVAAVRKGPNAEIRVRAMTWEGSRNVDIRLWSRSKEGDYVPSRKGVMFAAEKLDDVIAGLEQARQHV